MLVAEARRFVFCESELTAAGRRHRAAAYSHGWLSDFRPASRRAGSTVAVPFDFPRSRPVARAEVLPLGSGASTS